MSLSFAHAAASAIRDTADTASLSPLESGVAVEHADVVLVGNALDGLGGDDGLDDIFFSGEASKLGIACHEVVEEYHDYLVAVDKAVFALGITDDASDTVGIGVGCHYEVGTYFFCLCDGHCHCGRLFGVWRHYGGEVA